MIPFYDSFVIVRTRSDNICVMAAEKLKPAYAVVFPFLLGYGEDGCRLLCKHAEVVVYLRDLACNPVDGERF